MSFALPMPGPVWGPYPQRRGVGPTRWHRLSRLLPAMASNRESGQMLSALQALQGAQPQALPQLRAGLRAHGFSPSAVAAALHAASQAIAQELGLVPYAVQQQAAWHMLQGHLVELATGEGKSLVALLVAAVGAAAGSPVHVVTSNDYLVARDAERARRALSALGLRVGQVLSTDDAAARAKAYACDITWCTAKELVFDYLRDGLGTAGLGTGPRLLRGLCMAVVDEADHALLDEARVPLILSQPQQRVQDRPLLQHALAVAAKLQEGTHYRLARAPAWPQLKPPGQAALRSAPGPAHAQWANPRYREELVCMALHALHGLQAGRDYVLREGQPCLVDAMTGRPAPQRQWSQGLHQMVALKEGLEPGVVHSPVASLTLQEFFPRYHHLCGMSGTLTEARLELAACYGLAVRRVPRHRPLRLQLRPTRVLPTQAAVWAAAVQRTAQMHALGRPVLLGCDTVAHSEELGQALRAAGLPCQVLNAAQDRLENEIVARAGLRGRITVATQMAGRGTDIALGPGVAELGGLHVICCQFGGVRRIHRQLIGRAARQGEPGSAEALLCHTQGLLHDSWLKRPRWSQQLEELRQAWALLALRRAARTWRQRMDFAGPAQ